MFTALLSALVCWVAFAVLPAWCPQLNGEDGYLRTLPASRVDPNWELSGQFEGEIPIPSGLIRAITLRIDGTTVTDSALNDDAPWTLISNLTVTIPLRRGDTAIQLTGRDFKLLSQYLTGKLRENQTATTAGVTFASAMLPLGPPGWGFHSQDCRPNSKISITGTWAAASEYGASTTAITNGRLIPSVQVEGGEAPDRNRRMLVPVRKGIPVESAERAPGITLNKPTLAEELAFLFYRQEDSSVAADRVDGLVTRIVAELSGYGTLHDDVFRELRGIGMEWAGIDPTQVTAALPNGLDGTALFPAAPTWNKFPVIRGEDVTLTVDSVETVPPGGSDVTPAAGDRLHAIVVATVLPGAV